MRRSASKCELQLQSKSQIVFNAGLEAGHESLRSLELTINRLETNTSVANIRLSPQNGLWSAPAISKARGFTWS